MWILYYDAYTMMPVLLCPLTNGGCWPALNPGARTRKLNRGEVITSLYWDNLTSYSTLSILKAVTDGELMELWQVGVEQEKGLQMERSFE